MAAATMIATPIVIFAVSILLLFNPIWVSFEQDRSNVTTLTGYSSSQVHAITGSILSDLVFGPPDFDVTVDGTSGGQAVLDVRSQEHMRDVRAVFFKFGLVALLAVVILIGMAYFSRGQRWFWQAAATGTKFMLLAVLTIGAVFGLFFEQAFEAFHEMFFPPGSYAFDPATEKLVQLFPDQFWTETSAALSVAVFGLGILVFFGARRLGREPVDPAANPEAGSDSQPGGDKPPARSARSRRATRPSKPGRPAQS
jgi:integral membrane protein (TIGR01906 family)